jgi:hypothetical protein
MRGSGSNPAAVTPAFSSTRPKMLNARMRDVAAVVTHDELNRPADVAKDALGHP